MTGKDAVLLHTGNQTKPRKSRLCIHPEGMYQNWETGFNTWTKGNRHTQIFETIIDTPLTLIAQQWYCKLIGYFKHWEAFRSKNTFFFVYATPKN